VSAIRVHLCSASDSRPSFRAAPPGHSQRGATAADGAVEVQAGRDGGIGDNANGWLVNRGIAGQSSGIGSVRRHTSERACAMATLRSAAQHGDWFPRQSPLEDKVTHGGTGSAASPAVSHGDSFVRYGRRPAARTICPHARVGPDVRDHLVRGHQQPPSARRAGLAGRPAAETTGVDDTGTAATARRRSPNRTAAHEAQPQRARGLLSRLVDHSIGRVADRSRGG